MLDCKTKKTMNRNRKHKDKNRNQTKAKPGPKPFCKRVIEDKQISPQNGRREPKPSLVKDFERDTYCGQKRSWEIAEMSCFDLK